MPSRLMVVGAGPVGLMLAGELKLGGADVVVHDRLPQASGESRALGFNRRTLESFAQRGLLEGLGEFRQGAIGHFGGVRFDLGALEEDQSGVLGLSQARTEQMLREWLDRLGVPVLRGHELVALEDEGAQVVAGFATEQGMIRVSGDYLVGCDGAGSTVRALGGFETLIVPPTRAMCTVELAGVQLRPRPVGERLPGGNMVVCTPIGRGRYRIVLHDQSLPIEGPDLTFEQIGERWERLTGESLHGAEVSWTWQSTNRYELARSYRRGRVLLAGDAAHEMPPLAAWGLSAGIQDAVNLGWKLAAVAEDRAPDELLQSYDSERQPIGAQLVRNARAASLVYLSDESLDPARTVLAEVAQHGEAAEHLSKIVSGLGVRYEVGPGSHALLGARLSPEWEVVGDQGPVPAAYLLHPGRGVLVTTSEQDAGLPGWADRVDVVRGRWSKGGAGLTAVLLRPDGYVAWTDPGSGFDLTQALRRWFGPANAPVMAGEGSSGEMNGDSAHGH
ncbi:FAD-dependent monooxygenase [Kineosporia babensis]|uniref:FAD-dependent monooxygenase n=1 Tax=Kineosporia babensis TaxID=499548 RepID=A0A9X1SXL3_9ACTN|nr:FAD-dependent monooxygenase [Kineosporia babensis]MCD5315954.1 FAD-dependent monooxygenase [Kineosporia babensis]